MNMVILGLSIKGMSPEDAERYIKYCDECEKGIHNNHLGLDEREKKISETI